MIPITKPFLPPRQEYQEYLKGIWEREYLTNNGPLVQKLEKRLKNYLDVENMLFVSSGTIALQIAIKSLDLSGEIITTPFSYVATTSSIVWEGCTPIFVDIDPKTLNLNPNLIESAITSKTSAILATHVFGNPCDIENIQSIAEKYKLKVIYDAAHCFGTAYKGKCVFSYGDISATSFHATKLFHTVEGGALFTNNDDVLNKLFYMRNFGHIGPEPHLFGGIGINAKNSEYHAAMGLANLNYIKKILENRKKLCLRYDDLLQKRDIKTIEIQNGSKWNYAYYPVIFSNEEITMLVKENLEKHKIYPRRYFYPSLDTLPYVEKSQVPVSNDISRKIICLPLYYGLSGKDQIKIAQIINTTLNT